MAHSLTAAQLNQIRFVSNQRSGGKPRAFPCFSFIATTSSLSSALIVAAMATPSMISAGLRSECSEELLLPIARGAAAQGTWNESEATDMSFTLATAEPDTGSKACSYATVQLTNVRTAVAGSAAMAQAASRGGVLAGA